MRNINKKRISSSHHHSHSANSIDHNSSDFVEKLQHMLGLLLLLLLLSILPYLLLLINIILWFSETTNHGDRFAFKKVISILQGMDDDDWVAIIVTCSVLLLSFDDYDDNHGNENDVLVFCLLFVFVSGMGCYYYIYCCIKYYINK